MRTSERGKTENKFLFFRSPDRIAITRDHVTHRVHVDLPILLSRIENHQWTYFKQSESLL